jgi:hypothetical protein
MSEKKYVYEASAIFGEIEKLELVEETERFVTVLKKPIGATPYQQLCRKEPRFFYTWEEAHMYLVDVAARKFSSALAEMKRAAADKTKIESMRNPEAV